MAKPVGGLTALANELDRYQDSQGRVYEKVGIKLIQVRFIDPANPDTERTPEGYDVGEFTLPNDPNNWRTLRDRKAGN